jgi:hypothetical protein
MSELDRWALERIRYLLEPTTIDMEFERSEVGDVRTEERTEEKKDLPEVRDILNLYELPDLIDLRDHLEDLKN